VQLPTDVIVLGHSFGSMITSHAMADGFAARALILLNPISADPKTAAGVGITRLTRAFYGVSRASDGDRAPPARQLARRAVHEHEPGHHGRQAVAHVGARGASPLFQWILRPEDRCGGLRRILSTEVGKAAPRVTVPVLMIAGANDRIAPLSGQLATVGLFPDARLVVLPTVGHLIHYEAAAGAADAIRTFVDSL
jgi:Predicted hydrolases or acyltransferases (alpha/beta hydrolase superfamily)